MPAPRVTASRRTTKWKEATMRSRRVRVIVSAAAAGALFALTACSGAGGLNSANFKAETYFHGKTIHVVTSSDPGGGSDAKARVLASHLGQYIPGHPKLVVSNITPHIAGMNYTWKAPKDGTVIDLESASTLEFELFQGAQWNSQKFRYLGGVTSKCGSVMFVRGNLGYTNIKSIENRTNPQLTTIMQAPSPAGIEPYDVSTMLLASWLHMPLKVKKVSDSGTSALSLALQRNEINLARFGSDWCRFPQSNPGWLEKKYIVPLLDVNADGPSQMSPVIQKMGTSPPYVKDVLTPSQYAEWKAVVAAPRAGGNPVFLPPGTPDNVTKVLQKAYARASQDPKFQQAMAKAFGVGSTSDLRWFSADRETSLIQTNRATMLKYKGKITSLKSQMYKKYLGQ